MKVSVIMPVYNEAATLREIIRRVLAVPLDIELIAVDDGSTDGSGEILNEISDPRFRAIFEPRNRGKGWAIRRALEFAAGDAIIIQDADLEYDPQDYVRLVRALEEGAACVVYGNRLHEGNKRVSSARYLLGGMFLSSLANLLYGSRISDEPTCYKLFDARLLKSLRLTCERFEFCPEVTAKVLRLGYCIVDVPIRYEPRSFAEGKKIRWKDGVKAMWALIRTRFARRGSLTMPDVVLPPRCKRCASRLD